MARQGQQMAAASRRSAAAPPDKKWDLRTKGSLVAAGGRRRRSSTAGVVYALRNIDWPTALLFDCDGVLVDTEPEGHRVAFNQAFQRKGEEGNPPAPALLLLLWQTSMPKLLQPLGTLASSLHLIPTQTFTQA